MSTPDTPPRRRLVVTLDDEPSGATSASPPPTPTMPIPAAATLPPVPSPRPPIAVEPTTAAPPPFPPPAGPAFSDADGPATGSELPLASRGSRLLSRWLEGLIFALPLLLLWGLVAGFAALGASIVGLFILIAGLIAGLVITTLHPTRPGEHNGQTIARRILGLRLVHVDRTPIGWETMVKRRYLFPMLLLIPFGLGIVADRLWPLFDQRKRRLVDVLCQTEVVVALGTAPPASAPR